MQSTRPRCRLEPPMKVKPSREGLLVPFPGTKSYVPDAGCEVPHKGPGARYWLRAVNRGDLVLVKKKKTARSSSTSHAGDPPEESSS